MILMHLQWLNACCAWQQSLHACSMHGTRRGLAADLPHL
jgi:hypothetical protein